MDELISRDEVVRRLRGHYHGRYEICTEADLDWAIMGSDENESDGGDYWPNAVVLDHLADLIESAAPDMSKFMELPLDADGVPIRIGDVMYWPLNGETDEVVGIGDGVFFYTENGRTEWTQAATKRHAKSRTLGDIRLDIADAISGKDSDRIDALIREAYELGLKAAQQ